MPTKRIDFPCLWCRACEAKETCANCGAVHDFDGSPDGYPSGYAMTKRGMMSKRSTDQEVDAAEDMLEDIAEIGASNRVLDLARRDAAKVDAR